MILLVPVVLSVDPQQVFDDYDYDDFFCIYNVSCLTGINVTFDRYDGNFSGTLTGTYVHELNGTNHTGNLSSNRVVKDTGTNFIGSLLDFILDLLNTRDDAINTTSNIEDLINNTIDDKVVKANRSMNAYVNNTFLQNGSNDAVLSIINATQYLDRSLVGYWQFNNNQSNDSSIYGNNGTFIGNAHSNKDVLELDGNDYVDLGSSAIIGNEDTFTVSAWYKAINTPSDQVIYSEVQGAFTRFLILLVDVSDGDILASYDDDTSITTLSGGSGADDGKWHHAVFVRRATNDYELYLDGSLVDTSTISVAGPINPNDLRIGDAAGAFYLDGSIDEVMVFDRAINNWEVQQLSENLQIKENQAQYPMD